jgi:hypothetical protein
MSDKRRRTTYLSRRSPSSEIVFYQAEDGKGRIEVRPEENIVWLTQRLMAELLQTTVADVNIHLKNISQEAEQRSEATARDCLQVHSDGSAIKEHLVLAADSE